MALVRLVKERQIASLLDATRHYHRASAVSVMVQDEIDDIKLWYRLPLIVFVLRFNTLEARLDRFPPGIIDVFFPKELHLYVDAGRTTCHAKNSAALLLRMRGRDPGKKLSFELFDHLIIGLQQRCPFDWRQSPIRGRKFERRSTDRRARTRDCNRHY